MKRTSNIDKAQCSIYFTRFHQTINILDEDIKCVEIKPDITLGVRLTAGWQTRQRQDADSSCAVVTWGMVATCNCGAGAAVDTVNNYKQTHLYLHTAHLTHSLYIVWPCMTTRHSLLWPLWPGSTKIRTRRHYRGWTVDTGHNTQLHSVPWPSHSSVVCTNILLVVWALFRCSGVTTLTLNCRFLNTAAFTWITDKMLERLWTDRET